MGMADSVSPYAYVANNPINLVDPFGMEPSATSFSYSTSSSRVQSPKLPFRIPRV